MKILWLSHLVPYPPKGGVLQRSYHLVRELAKYHEVYVLAFNQPDLVRPMFSSVSAGLQEAETEMRKYCKQVKFIEIPCEHKKFGKPLLALKSLFSSSSYTVNWLKSSEYKKAIIDWRKQYDFDLVHADTISLAPYIELFDRAKTSLDHHNIESHMMLRRAKLESNILKKCYFYQEGWKLQAYEKKVCPRFDINITCSKLDSQRLQDFCAAPNIIDIPNGVDIDYFKPSDAQDINKSLIFAGRLNAYTNKKAVIALVNDIWPQVRSAVGGMTLDIVGANPPELVKQAAEQDEAITVHGFVDDVREYLNKAGLYVCPITDGGGTKLKILDALAMAKVIVGNAEAFEGIDIEHMHSAVVANTAEEYAACIKALFSDEALIKQISIEARKLVEQKYAYSSIGKKLSQVLVDICQN